MILVISSPSISTMGFFTLILSDTLTPYLLNKFTELIETPSGKTTWNLNAKNNYYIRSLSTWQDRPSLLFD